MLRFGPACIAVLIAGSAWAVPVGPTRLPADSAKPSAASGPARAVDSASKAAGSAKPATDPVKAKLAARIERTLRTEYLKATDGITCPVIKAESLKVLIGDTNLVLIDIRQADEQAVSMLPGALTTREFAERFRKGIPKEKRLVVYCTLGYRSGKYAMELAGQKIRAENLEGGLMAWSHVGGDLVVKNPDGLVTPTRRVHVYSQGWNFLHPDYQAVW